MSASPVVFLQRFKIGPGLQRGIPKGFHVFFAAVVRDPVVKAVREAYRQFLSHRFPHFTINRTGASRRSFLSVCVVVGPCDRGEALQTSNDHIIITAGAVDHQQISVLVSAANDAHMGIIRVERQVTGLCIRP